MIHNWILLKKTAHDFSFHFIPNAKILREKFSQNMKHNRIFQMKTFLWYITGFCQKKPRKIFHSILFQNEKLRNFFSDKIWYIIEFFVRKIKTWYINDIAIFEKFKKLLKIIFHFWKNILKKYDTLFSFSPKKVKPATYDRLWKISNFFSEKK